MSFKYDPAKINLIKKAMIEAQQFAYVEDGVTPRYTFEPTEVVEVLTQKKNHGSGYWFRLIDGRMINHLGEQDEIDFTLYPGSLDESA